MLPASDASAFDQLKLLVDSEGLDLASPDWMGMLAAISIAQGQPFNPDANTRAILDRAAKTAYKTSRVIGFEQILNGVSYRVYPDRHWLNPFASGPVFDTAWMTATEGILALDTRINFFTNYYSISPGMISQTPGLGAKYMIGKLSTQATTQRPCREFLVCDTLRGRELVGSCQRPTISVARLPRQACAGS